MVALVAGMSVEFAAALFPLVLVYTVGQWYAAYGRCRKCKRNRSPKCECTDVRRPVFNDPISRKKRGDR